MSSAKRFAALAVMTLTLASCTVGPNYVRPDAAVPDAFKESEWKKAEPQDALDRGKWWELFGDAQLNALAERVSLANQTVRVAEAQYRQSEAFARQARAGLYPILTGGGAVTRRQVGAAQIARQGTTYATSLDASWEPDLWGRVRRSIEAGEAGVQASIGDLESIRLSAQAALAQNYFLLRIADLQRQLLDDTAAAYERSLELTRNRYTVGVVPRVDVVQAEAQLKSTQALAIDIGVQRAQLEHAIAILVGEPPANFAIAPAPLIAVVPDIPAGMPSALLERRPDIAAAERRVAQANAQIGVTQAAFYPSLTLSASGGYSSASFARWFDLPSRFWSLGPSIAQYIFDGGLRRAQTAQAVAVYDAQVADYRATVLQGFLEVEDNLAALRILEEEARVQDEAVRAARESLALTTNQYKAGIITYLNVVTVQATALANERTAVNILSRRLNACVLLVKAIGGGWAGLPRVG